MIRGLALAFAVVLATTAGAQEQTQPPDMLAVQVLIDRAGFSPGVIDGRGGSNTDKAIDAYQRVTGNRVDQVAASSEPPTITYTITAEDAATPFVRSIPRDPSIRAFCS